MCLMVAEGALQAAVIHVILSSLIVLLHAVLHTLAGRVSVQGCTVRLRRRSQGLVRARLWPCIPQRSSTCLAAPRRCAVCSLGSSLHSHFSRTAACSYSWGRRRPQDRSHLLGYRYDQNLGELGTGVKWGVIVHTASARFNLDTCSMCWIRRCDSFPTTAWEGQGKSELGEEEKTFDNLPVPSHMVHIPVWFSGSPVDK